MQSASTHAHDDAFDHAANLLQGGLLLLFSKTIQQLSLDESLRLTTQSTTEPGQERNRQLSILSYMYHTYVW